MDTEPISGYGKAEHYSTTARLEDDFNVDISIFTVYRDAEGDLEDEFQMINYRFNRDVTQGAEQFREEAENFSDYSFFPIISDYRAPTEITVMVDSDDKVEIAEFAENLIQQAHSEIGF